MESPLAPVPTILLNNLNMKQHWNKCETSLSITLFGMAILQSKSQSMKMFGMTITWVLWKHLDFALHHMHEKRRLIIKEKLNNNNDKSASEWTSDAAAHLDVVLEDHHWTNQEWDSICCLLAELDSKHFVANPVLVPTPTACKSETKNDSDSPGWWEATTCSKSEQLWTAMDKKPMIWLKRKHGQQLQGTSL